MDDDFPPGLRADFLIALVTARANVERVVRMSRALPDRDECHEVRHILTAVLMRLGELEALALTWSR